MFIVWESVLWYKGWVYLFARDHPLTMDSIQPTLLDCSDSVASLHKRMDSFYSWASQLQVEHRDLKQRVGFVEGVVLNGVDGGVSIGPI